MDKVLARQGQFAQGRTSYCYAMATAACLNNMRDILGLPLPERFNIPLMAAQIHYTQRGLWLPEIVADERHFLQDLHQMIQKDVGMLRAHRNRRLLRHFGEWGSCPEAVRALGSTGIYAAGTGPQITFEDLEQHSEKLADLRQSLLRYGPKPDLESGLDSIAQHFDAILKQIFPSQPCEIYPGSQALLTQLEVQKFDFDNGGPDRNALQEALKEHPWGVYISLVRRPQSQARHAVLLMEAQHHGRPQWCVLDSQGESGWIRDHENLYVKIKSYCTINLKGPEDSP